MTDVNSQIAAIRMCHKKYALDKFDSSANSKAIPCVTYHKTTTTLD